MALKTPGVIFAFDDARNLRVGARAGGAAQEGTDRHGSHGSSGAAWTQRLPNGAVGDGYSAWGMEFFQSF